MGKHSKDPEIVKARPLDPIAPYRYEFHPHKQKVKALH